MKKTVRLENLSFEQCHASEKIACPLCSSQNHQSIIKEHGMTLVRCLGCGLVFANPRPNLSELMRFYDGYFPPESAPLWQEQMAEVFRKEGVDFIRSAAKSGVFRCSETPKLLDIGSGMGFFLKMMKNEGWLVQGVEPSEKAVRHAVDILGVPVYHGTVEHAAIDKDYDVITLWYVLEHVPNPDFILKRCSELSRSGGLLIIRVPNQNIRIDWWLKLFHLDRFFLINPPRHLFDYSPETMRRFLSKENYEVIKIVNSLPRKTGTLLERIRRWVWYSFFSFLFHLSGGRIIGGSSMTIYAIKK